MSRSLRRHAAERGVMIVNDRTTLAQQYDGIPEIVGVVRNDIRRWLSSVLDDETLFDVCLMVSELASNAIKHSRSNGQSFKVRGLFEDTVLRIEVTDLGSSLSVPVQKDDPDADNGRGLSLISKLSTTWGVMRGRAKTIVWFEITLSGRVQE